MLVYCYIKGLEEYFLFAIKSYIIVLFATEKVCHPHFPWKASVPYISLPSSLMGNNVKLHMKDDLALRYSGRHTLVLNLQLSLPSCHVIVKFEQQWENNGSSDTSIIIYSNNFCKR